MKTKKISTQVAFWCSLYENKNWMNGEDFVAQKEWWQFTARIMWRFENKKRFLNRKIKWKIFGNFYLVWSIWNWIGYALVTIVCSPTSIHNWFENEIMIIFLCSFLSVFYLIFVSFVLFNFIVTQFSVIPSAHSHFHFGLSFVSSYQWYRNQRITEK